MWLGFASNVAWGVAFVTANALLLRHGAFGLSSARFIAYLVQAILLFGYVFIFVIGARSNAPVPIEKELAAVERADEQFAPTLVP